MRAIPRYLRTVACNSAQLRATNLRLETPLTRSYLIFHSRFILILPSGFNYSFNVNLSNDDENILIFFQFEKNQILKIILFVWTRCFRVTPLLEPEKGLKSTVVNRPYASRKERDRLGIVDELRVLYYEIKYQDSFETYRKIATCKKASRIIQNLDFGERVCVLK